MKKQYMKKRIIESVSDKQQLLAKIQQYNGANIDRICTIASDKIKVPDSFVQSPNGYSEQYWIALPNGTELYVVDFGDFKQYYADVGEDSRFPFVMIGVSNDETRYKFMYIDPRDSQVEMGRPKLAPGRTVSEKKDISKKYTKRQIQEAIAYWERQLKTGNYKKLDESRYDTDAAAEAYAGHEAEIGAIAAQLEQLPKNDTQEAAYDKVGDLALDNAGHSYGYTKAEQLVYDFGPVVADDFQNGIEFGKSRDDRKWQAKVVLAAICKCPAKTVDEYDEWLQHFMLD